MIPRRHAIAATLVLTALPVLPGGCGDHAPEPDRPPRGQRSEGPELDVAMLGDPAVQAFAAQAATFLELNRLIAPLEARLADGSITEDETATWRDLDTRRVAERSRLNALMYAPEVSSEQRAAMWWVLQGRIADTPETTTTETTPADG